MKLIQEVNDNDFVALTETVNDKKDYFIEGIFMQADIKNRNGRIYPNHVLQEQYENYNENYILKNRAIGELDHPASLKINSDRISHLVVEMSPQGSNYYGKAKLLDTPMGNIAKSLIDGGVSLGVSTRGLGNVVKRSDGIMEVAQYRLMCVDIVSDPSGPDCFVKGIMENTEYYYDIATGNWVAQETLAETVKELKTEYKSTVKKIDESKVIAAFERFLKTL